MAARAKQGKAHVVSGLFDDGPEEVLEALHTAAGVRLEVVCWGRCQFFSFYRAAQPETGLMVWDAARVLCRLVENQHPVTFEGRRVVELGAGAHGLASLVAARSARRVVATDGCPLVVRRLGNNQRRNACKVVWERLHTAELSWGNQAHIQATRAAHAPQGFDVVCGADLLYQRAALPLLFATCKALLARSGVVLLACKPRNGIGVEAYAEAAQEAGLVAVHTAWMDDVAVLQLRL